MSLDAAEESIEDEEQQQQQDEAQGLGVDHVGQATAAGVGSKQLQQDGSIDQASAAAAAAAGEELPEVFKAAAAQPLDTSVVIAAADHGVQIRSSSTAEGSGSSSSSGDKSSNFPLSRDRTMAPDINRRPADSSRPRVSSSSSSSGSSWWGGLGGLGGSLNPSRSMSRFVRNISRRFGSRSDVAAGNAAAAAAAAAAVGDASSDEDAFGDKGLSSNRGGLASSFAYAQLAITRSVQSLFVPPVYLPGGPLYASGSAASTAAAAADPAVVRLQKVDSGKVFGRQESRSGLALLAPIRSLIVLSHQASLQRGVSMHAAAAAKHGTSNGDAAAAAAVVGQLVADEKRETGSVSWSVYGAYAQQVGLVTSWLMLSALVLGQGVFLAADWWLAIWSSSPTGQQLHMR
jgi:hypothetical protein